MRKMAPTPGPPGHRGDSPYLHLDGWWRNIPPNAQYRTLIVTLGLRLQLFTRSRFTPRAARSSVQIGPTWGGTHLLDSPLARLGLRAHCLDIGGSH
jgi:hypothetical protein